MACGQVIGWRMFVHPRRGSAIPRRFGSFTQHAARLQQLRNQIRLTLHLQNLKPRLVKDFFFAHKMWMDYMNSLAPGVWCTCMGNSINPAVRMRVVKRQLRIMLFTNRSWMWGGANAGRGFGPTLFSLVRLRSSCHK